MRNIKPYDNYKDSEIDWLGNIPEHWKYSTLRWLSRVFSGGTPSKDIPRFWENGTIPWLSSGEVNRRKIDYSTKYITEEALINSSAKWIPEKSLIIALAGQGKTKGKIATIEASMTCNQSLGAIIPIKTELFYKFLAFYLESKYKQIRGLVGDGLRDGLNLEHVKSISIPIPPIPEQQTIAAFLDYKLGKIDRFILKKKKLIKLLNEQKAAIINQAVTKGLDANAKMKPSGIDWLGDIPEHWEVIKLQYLCRIRTGGKNTEDRKADGEYNFYVRSQKIEKIDSYSFDGEGILTAGDGVGVGKVFHYVNEKFDYHQRVYLFYKFAEKVFPKHLFYFLKTYLKIDLMLYNAKSTVDSVRLPILKAFQVITPPKDEQIKIVEFIENETANINQTISTIEKEIALVQEYRTTLIAEAVTGKIDVRGYEIPTLTTDEEILDETETDIETDEEIIEEDAE